MANLISWLGSNWQQLALSLLAIDAVLIPLFPKVQLLVTLKSFLSGLGAKQG